MDETDFMTVYLDGFYDGEKKWKNKIQNAIDDYKNRENGEKNWECEITVLEAVLKGA